MKTLTYPKIHALYKRHTEGPEKGKFIFDDWAQPEFEYLALNRWLWYEKVDGTNIRLSFEYPLPHQEWFRGHERSYIQGRSDNAQIAKPLMAKLEQKMVTAPFEKVFPRDVLGEGLVTLYGEGYGAGIQKGGCYIADGVDFVLFDVMISKEEKIDGRWMRTDYWLDRTKIEDIALELAWDIVDIAFEGTLQQAEDQVRQGFNSAWPGVTPEGFVGRPEVPIYNSKGQRITTKIKHVDYVS